MNTELINPFLHSLSHVLTTMATLKIIRGKPSINPTKSDFGDVCANINLQSTQLDISMAMSFTQDAILDIYARMLGEEANDINAEVESLVGELSNMVIGVAKQQLDHQGFDFAMAIPTVSRQGNSMTQDPKCAIIYIPYNTYTGHIYLQLQFHIKQPQQSLSV